MENKNIINIGEKRIIADTISLLNSIDHSKFIKNLFDRFNRYFNIELIQEEIFETQLKENFVNAKKEALKNFELLVVALEKTNDVCNFTKFLSNVYIDPVVNFQTYNTYTFKNYNLPKQVKDYFEKEKNSTGDIIKIISKINPNPFDDTIVNGLTDAYKRGGNVGLRFFDIDIDFAILDPNVIKWIKKHGLELSKNVTKQMSSAIRYELINGLKNNESILELKKRILNVFDKQSITVKVPPKYESGILIKRGYEYDLTPDYWATMVARTETAYAFTQGRLESYKQTGIVSYVEFFTAEDELTCPECSTLNGVYYKLEDADGVIPVHPHCKCTFLPVLNGDYSEMKDIAESNLLAVYS